MIPEITDSVGGIFLYARICKKHDWKEYERLKALLAKLNLAPVYYSRATRTIAKLLEL